MRGYRENFNSKVLEQLSLHKIALALVCNLRMIASAGRGKKLGCVQCEMVDAGLLPKRRYCFKCDRTKSAWLGLQLVGQM